MATSFKDFVSPHYEAARKIEMWAKYHLKFSYENEMGELIHMRDWPADRSYIKDLFTTDGKKLQFTDKVKKVFHLLIDGTLPPVVGDQWEFGPGVAYHGTHGAEEFSVEFTDCHIDDFSTLPACTQSIAFMGDEFTCKVNSLKGLEHLKELESFYIDSEAAVEFRCGLMSLFRLPKFKYISQSSSIKNHNRKSLSALQIIEPYLHGRSGKMKGDVAECMDELIEAGLKEYAKL
jgi:hypothetical protein